ncbi:hypothetical protein ATCC90586_004504 [Pythium insidiosum]|nr:hypothetical protein ATCC90586_004504 [Pythium insidiosum]
MSHAHLEAAARGAMEMFDEIARIEHELASDFARHDDRQERFKRQFDRETRRHNKAISGMACVLNSSPSSDSVLFVAPNTAVDDGGNTRHIAATTNDSQGTSRRVSTIARHLERLKNPTALRLREELKSFYLPPVLTSDLLCDTCGAFRRSVSIIPLPKGWQEYVCEDTHKHYYYHREQRHVLWTPPPETDPFSVFVFERTNSVFTVCRCIPSHERRRRLLEKLREYAMHTAQMEANKRNRELHGAFRTLAHTVLKK